MKENRTLILGAGVGLIIGIATFIWITRNLFLKNIFNFGMWRILLLFVVEPTIAGALVVFLYQKLMHLKWKKFILWTIYLVIVSAILWFTIIWFMAMDLGYGIMGL